MEDEPLVIRPDAGAALRWSMVGVALVLVATWLARDAGPLGWIALGVAIALAGYFVLQLVAPGLFQIVCDHHGLHGRTLLQRVDAPWESIHLARVSRIAGDPLLTVTVRDRYESTTAGLLLPVGADLEALHGVLGRRLGRGVPSEP